MANHWERVNSGSIVVSNTPEGLWEAACRYFKSCDDDPIFTKALAKSGNMAGSTFKQEHIRPYTVKGFCLHAGIQEEYLRDLRSSKDKDSLYYLVVSRILYTIHTQNTELAILGIYNPIFTAKLLNMDQDDVPVDKVRIEIVTGQPALSESENEVLEKLDQELDQFPEKR